MKETISKKDTGIKNRVGRFLALTLAVLLALQCCYGACPPAGAA